MQRLIPGLAVLALAACSRGPTVRWSETTHPSTATRGGAAPMFAVAPDGGHTLAWVSAPGAGTAGRLYVETAHGVSELADPLGDLSIYGEVPPKIAYGPGGVLYAAYVVKKVVPGRKWPVQALRFARSDDGGAHWAEPVTVTDDSVFGAHDDHSLHVAADGTIYLTWLDRRSGTSHVYLTTSADGGRTWAPNRAITETEACPCCRTALASGPDGKLYVAWRRIFPGDVRDIVVARSDDHGATWSEPVRVHEDGWVVHACPDAGPSLAVGADGRVHVAWWTGKEGRAGVQYAVAPAGAARFSAPVPLGLAEFSRPAHVQLALAGDSTVLAVWDDGTTKIPEIVLRASTDGGRSFAKAVPVSAKGRSAGYPVITTAGQGFTVAWQEQDTVAARAAAAAHQEKMKANDPTAHVGAVGALQVALRRGTLP
ncbi:MAG TPA: sialidase family protein [Gemmatimonadales bacterium]|nr:sialidase family protein [Gemmatimonadales bacterium]